MSELTDLEQLKKEVKNLKKYLTLFAKQSFLLYDEIKWDGDDWEESIQKSMNTYKLLSYIADDLFIYNDINGYYTRWRFGDEDKKTLLKRMDEDKRRKYENTRRKGSRSNSRNMKKLNLKELTEENKKKTAALKEKRLLSNNSGGTTKKQLRKNNKSRKL
jgi:hypothetical protein